VTQIKIFGREPGLWIALIGAGVTWAASLGFDWLNAGQATAIVTFITAAIIALVTRPIGPPLFVAAVSAGAAMFGQYQLHWSAAAVTGLGTIILAGFALLGIRPQVTPNNDPKVIQGTIVAPVGPVK
jgi:hypothetical protein